MSSKRIVAVGVLLLVGAVVAVRLLVGEGDRPVASDPEPPDGLMTEEERQAYVEAFVRAEDVRIGPDLKPDSDEVVPGLLRVTGQLVNEGEATLDTVVVVIFPKDESGEVIAMDQQDVIDEPFRPGDRRAFRFQIRDRPRFAGAFDHDLR